MKTEKLITNWQQHGKSLKITPKHNYRGAPIPTKNNVVSDALEGKAEL